MLRPAAEAEVEVVAAAGAEEELVAAVVAVA
jgi:hypothetical protein